MLGRGQRTIVRHSQDRDLCDGAVSSFDTSCALVDGGQIRVHVTGVTTTTWHFFSGGGNLTQGIAVRRQVRQDDQDMLLQLVSVVFSRGQRKTRSDDTLDTAIG